MDKHFYKTVQAPKASFYCVNREGIAKYLASTSQCTTRTALSRLACYRNVYGLILSLKIHDSEKA